MRISDDAHKVDFDVNFDGSGVVDLSPVLVCCHRRPDANEHFVTTFDAQIFPYASDESHLHMFVRILGELREERLGPPSDVEGLPKTMMLVTSTDAASSFGECDHLSSLNFSISQRTCTESALPVEKCNVATQTLDTQALPLRFPPRAPRRTASMSRQQAYRAPVKLNTRRLVMPQFREVQQETLTNMVHGIVVRMNPRGKGCCRRHIALHALSRHVLELLASACDQRINSSWQCNMHYIPNLDQGSSRGRWHNQRSS